MITALQAEVLRSFLIDNTIAYPAARLNKEASHIAEMDPSGTLGVVMGWFVWTLGTWAEADAQGLAHLDYFASAPIDDLVRLVPDE